MKMPRTSSRPAAQSTHARRPRDLRGDRERGPTGLARQIERQQARADQRARKASARLKPAFQMTRFVSSTVYPVEAQPLADGDPALIPSELVIATDGAAAGIERQPVLARTVAAIRALNEGINGTPPKPSAMALRKRPGSGPARRVARAVVQTADRFGGDGKSLLLLTMPILAMLIAFGTSENLRQGRRMPEPLAPVALAVPEDQAPLVIAASPAPDAMRAGPAVSLRAAEAGPAVQPSAREAPSAAQPSLVAVEPVAPPRPLADRAVAPFDVAALTPMPKTVPSRVFIEPTEDVVEPVGDAIPLPGQDLAGPAAQAAHCKAAPDLMLTSAQRADPLRLPPVPPLREIGPALAAAARAQVQDLVVYDERYRRIAYPMGDVSPFYGVCTDVVIRAYRAIGIDLQYAVEASGMGTDTNVDHRRTETLRRFFTRHGESLPVSTFAEDYRPGDIVTYYRPQNSGSRSHIAVVSDVIAPSGRYMIVHNRGWGPQIEDGLFVDEITGHYRYTGSGPSRPPETLLVARAPAQSVVRTPILAAIVRTPPPQSTAQTGAELRAAIASPPSGKLARAPLPVETRTRSVAQARLTVGRLPVAVPAAPATRVVQRRSPRAAETAIRTDFGLSR